jgi:TetR/AcrR family transcriptional regulator, cholesterol catabolism regulator
VPVTKAKVNIRCNLRTMTPASRPAAAEKPTRLGRPRGSARKEDRLDDLVRVAARLFRDRGYRATRLDDIADELGVTRAALYYYFDTKQALLEEICRRTLGLVEVALGDALGVVDPVDRLRAFTRQAARNTATDAARVFFRERKELRPEIAQQLRERAHSVTRGAEEIIEAGIAAGRFHAVNVEVVAPGLLAMLNSLPDWVRPARHGTLEEVTEQLLDVFLRGICVDPAHVERPPEDATR